MAKDKKKGKVTYTFNGEGKRRNVFGKLLVIAIFVIVIVGRSVGFLTDWMWFRELGFTRVFLDAACDRVKARDCNIRAFRAFGASISK